MKRTYNSFEELKNLKGKEREDILNWFKSKEFATELIKKSEEIKKQRQNGKK